MQLLVTNKTSKPFKYYELRMHNNIMRHGIEYI